MSQEVFDPVAFGDRVHERYEEYQGELINTKDKKAEIFLQVSYFQSCLQDSMELMLQTEKARRIPPKTIVNILAARGVLSEQDAKDAVKIIKIRNLFAHGYHEKSIESQAEKIIGTIKLQFPENKIKNKGDELLNIWNEKLINEGEEWDWYQRLDYICFNLIFELETNVLFLEY